MTNKIKLDLQSKSGRRGSLTVSVDKKVFGNLLSNDLRIELPMTFDFEFPECECCQERGKTLTEQALERAFGKPEPMGLYWKLKQLDTDFYSENTKPRK